MEDTITNTQIDSINEIVSRFTSLPNSLKDEVILKLNDIYKPIAVNEFAQLVQKMYKQNISFDVQQFEIGKVQVTCITPFGEFTKSGKSQVEAKQKSVQKAFAEFTSNHSKQK